MQFGVYCRDRQVVGQFEFYLDGGEGAAATGLSRCDALVAFFQTHGRLVSDEDQTDPLPIARSRSTRELLVLFVMFVVNCTP